jgi:hypothetical protein
VVIASVVMVSGACGNNVAVVTVMVLMPVVLM